MKVKHLSISVLLGLMMVTVLLLLLPASIIADDPDSDSSLPSTTEPLGANSSSAPNAHQERIDAAPIKASAVLTAYSVRSDVDDLLYQIDLTTGVATAIGPVGFADVESLTFSSNDAFLYGVDDVTDQLITISLTTGAGTAVGSLGVSVVDHGLTLGCGNLWLSSDAPGNFYSLNPISGTATLIGAQGQAVTGLAAFTSTVYGMGGDNTNNLVRIDTTTGAATSVGPLGAVSVADGGVDFDANGVLWGLNDVIPGQVFTISLATGQATIVTTTVNTASTPIGGFESLAITTGKPCITYLPIILKNG
jgi:hypothetical protein